ncbi:MAG TPA: DUF1127 domain-containing protein [Xanthobacteraceae bacterium]|nr:DUF1127 domain-containing protein [Xanthobacteraceae bacterium]
MILSQIIRYVRERIRARRVLAELKSLNDRELADIGLTRADVAYIALDCR